MEPSIPARITDLLVDELPLPLTRVLFPRARTLPDGGAISEEFFCSLLCVASVLESESTDGGRDAGVAVKIEESRRWATLDGRAGVLPAVPLTLFFLFSYMASKDQIQHKCKKNKKNKQVRVPVASNLTQC